MRLKKMFVLIVMMFVVFLPINVFAVKQCSDYSADKCPGTSCMVKEGVCVKAHIGDNFCSEEKIINVFRVIGYFIFIARIFVPFIIIIMGSKDLFHAVLGGDEKAVSQSARKFGIRVLIGLCVFFVPSIIHSILSFISGYNAVLDDIKICQTCLLKPFDCENGVPTSPSPIDENIFVQDDPEDEEEDEPNDNSEIRIDKK